MSRSSAGPSTTIWDDIAANPSVPAASADGAAITKSADGSTATYAAIELWRTTGTGSVTLTGPLDVYAYNAVDAVWVKLEPLDKGADVAFSDVLAASFKVEHLAALYTRFQIVAGAAFPASTGVTAKYREIVEDHRRAASR